MVAALVVRPKAASCASLICTNVMQDDFDRAAEDAKTLPDGTSNDDKLALYGLFKQGMVGDVNSGKPGIFDQKGE